MKIALFGASGTIGRRIAQEALARGHTVTAIVREPARMDLTHERLNVAQGDVRDADSVARLVAGYDVVVSAVGPARGSGEPPQMLVEAARALVAGLPRAGVRRLVVVNGAGSLEVSPGVQLLDTPSFPPAWRPGALAHRDALEVYRTADLDWTALSPANSIAPGQHTGRYRTGGDQLVANEQGESRISAEDYAVALIDEVETPRPLRQRFTAAY